MCKRGINVFSACSWMSPVPWCPLMDLFIPFSQIKKRECAFGATLASSLWRADILKDNALHPNNTLILCFQFCHTVFAHIVAKSTNPSGSFIIWGLPIMRPMLHNNDFFFSVYFCSFDISILIHSFCCAQSGFFSPLRLHIWSFFRYQIRFKFVLCHKDSPDVPRTVKVQHNSDFVRSEIPFNPPLRLLRALIHTQCVYFFAPAWWSIPLWSLRRTHSLLMQLCSAWRGGGGGGSPGPRSECSAVSVRAPPPDVTICPSVCRSLRSPSISSNRRSVVHLLLLHFSFDQHSSFHLFPESVRMFACAFCNCQSLVSTSQLKKCNLHMCDVWHSRLDSRNRNH